LRAVGSVERDNYFLNLLFVFSTVPF